MRRRVDSRSRAADNVYYSLWKIMFYTCFNGYLPRPLVFPDQDDRSLQRRRVSMGRLGSPQPDFWGLSSLQRPI
ncbi:hypothetical protein PoB_003804100 [Plakobranchus ocellatus]|uniref:Uncharacterized protein n=1 Tax=Plakobranchus ocellatus TaxID=259542 RepID=A0AAV4AYD7_9GAST|nr:hypothetical protein PoB_003804100 [Plakobranchus ocellatus]